MLEYSQHEIRFLYGNIKPRTCSVENKYYTTPFNMMMWCVICCFDSLSFILDTNKDDSIKDMKMDMSVNKLAIALCGKEATISTAEVSGLLNTNIT